MGKDGNPMRPHTSFCLETQFILTRSIIRNFLSHFLKPGGAVCLKDGVSFLSKIRFRGGLPYAVPHVNPIVRDCGFTVCKKAKEEREHQNSSLHLFKTWLVRHQTDLECAVYKLGDCPVRSLFSVEK